MVESQPRREIFDPIRLSALQAALAARPRIPLGQFPTPLEEAPNLSRLLGVRILVKRDDLTGLALGGNKVRKLEYLIGEARASGADCVITTGGSQSNHARLAAAACRKVQIDCYLVLDRGLHPENQGNLLLDRLFGAHVTLIDSMDPADALTEMESLAAGLGAGGMRPYVIPRGGSVPTGASGYAACVAELVEQLDDADVQPTCLYLGTGSCGTHSGVLAGVVATGASFRVQGIGVSRTAAEQVERIYPLSNRTLEHLGLPESVIRDLIYVDDRFVGPGYGHPTRETMEAIEIMAREEALIMDPVYTGKALAGLIRHAREGRFTSADTVVFLHTGGAPALFAYNEETSAALDLARA